MLKKIMLALVLFGTNAVFACDEVSTSDPSFCSKFRVSTACYCKGLGLPAAICQDNKKLYNYMLSMFGTLDKACKAQRNTSVQMCINSWNCYFKGGKSSDGTLCSSTGNRCDTL